MLWDRLRNNRIGFKFKRQVSIGVYIADFYCKEKSVAIELDGFQHIENKSYDEERELYFLSLGIITVRFWNNEIDTDLDKVIEKIKNTVASPDPRL